MALIKKDIKIAVIGAGKIGEAIINSLIEAGYKNIVATCRTERRKKELSYLPIDVFLDNRKAASKSDILIVSVKPNQVVPVLSELKDYVVGGKRLVISVAAIITTSYLEDRFRGIKVIRAMPNINIIARHSATAICRGKNIDIEDIRIARELFEAMGFVIEVDEKYMDAITAYSGSGPAYVLEFFESFLLAGLKIGLPRDIAYDLAIHTIIGSAKLLERGNKHPAEYRDMVITPGGVTIDAVHILERTGFKADIIDAIKEAYEKAKDIASILI
ncbi:MAG: pyrroline-5-carboxylate reductase [Thermoproteales archaeon]|nr:pyrroline-5-carboxylate reductase [Thermoproteales archaeon]